ncbi:PilZ domain-containing protein [Spirochaetia bacterium 38H-sp]|uniref:PilZ domain-containing protein n=1 Tax=Rarispira pelagica TaxID=3141764 RepID=A0ABU9UD15_9SPIR
MPFLPLLRYEFEFFSEPDPTVNRITLIILAAIILLVIVLAQLNSRKTAKGAKTGYSKWRFSRSARKLGFSSFYIKILDRLIKKYNIPNPDNLLLNNPILDSILKREITEIENESIPETEKDLRKHHLFLIKQVIEANRPRLARTTSSKYIKQGESVKILIPSQNKVYSTDVLENSSQYLILRAPRNEKGNIVYIPPGTRINISFTKYENNLFSGNTVVRDFKKDGQSKIYVAHIEKMQQVLQRRHKRAEIYAPCYYYPVSIVSTTSRKRQAVVDANKRFSGTIINISAGGCGIKTLNPLKVGMLVKINFKTDTGDNVTAYGKIRSITFQKGQGNVMHIMFTSMTKHHLNEIREIIYDMRPLS